MVQIRRFNVQRNKEMKIFYTRAIGSGKNHDDVIKELSDKYPIGDAYIRTILKGQGVKISRKKEYTKKNVGKLSERDNKIVSMFNDGTDTSVIAKKFSISQTRIQQILRSKLGKTFRKKLGECNFEELDKKSKEIIKKLEAGSSYDEVVEKYGKPLLNEIKSIGCNIFKVAQSYKIKDFVRMAKSGKSPKEIAAKYGVTLNYAYMILHENGIRYQLSDEDKLKRDQNISEEIKTSDVITLSKKYKLTPTMIRIIVKKMRSKK